MDKDNVLYVGSKKEIVDFDAYESSLKKEIEKNTQAFPGADTAIVLSIDREVAYENFLRLFALTQKNGSKIRLVYKDTEPAL